MKQKSVLMISKRYSPHIGGVEKHMDKVMRILRRKGYKFTVLTEKYKSNLQNNEIKNSVTVVRFSYPKIKVLGVLYIWFWLIRNLKLVRKSEIVHIHDVFVWYLPIKFILPNKKVYLTNHGWEGVYPIPLKNIFLKRISTFLSSGSISVGFFVDKYYGIKSDYITYGATKMPSEFKRKKKKIVFIGRLDSDTGINVLLGAVKYFKGYKIEFCGDGPLRDKCAKYGKVHGFVRVERHLSEASICFCSGYLTLLEAMSNRCIPVAAFENSLKKSYYTDTPFANWIVAGDDPKKLYDDSQKLLRNSESRNFAFKWVKNQKWETLAEAYMNIWNNNI